MKVGALTYEAEHLRKDADLEPLRALPRFEELVRAAAEKAKHAKLTPPAQAEVKDGVWDAGGKEGTGDG